MLRLTTFGQPVIERDGAILGGSAGQRRVLALLAILAAARDRGMSRDSVIALLWPDTEPEKARQSLTQALYHTRRAVGEDELFVASEDVRINPLVISSDVGDFKNALERHELEQAVSLYVGPFLEGFYVNAAPEFERWASATRAELSEQCAGALEALASNASTTSDHDAAVRLWKRRAGLEPLNTRVAMKLMLALAASGDRGGAIQQGRVHETILRQELDVTPDGAFQDLLSRLLGDTTWMRDTIEPAPSSAPPPNDRDASVAGPAAVSPRDETGVTTHERPTAFTASLRWTRGRSLAFAAVIVVFVLGMVWVARIVTRGNGTTARDLVVVSPFRVSGADGALAYLREGLVDLLATKLTEDDAIAAADPGAVMAVWRRAGVADRSDVPRREVLRLAQRLGGKRLVEGSVVGTPARLVINASLITIGDGALRAQASVEGNADSITTLVDQLVTRLLAKDAGAWERLANHTSTSSQALRAFLDGRAAYRRGSYRDAIRHFSRALEIDSMFAMAGLGLANAADRINVHSARQRGLAAAWAARDELVDRDRTYLEALVGPRYPAASSEREQLSSWERAAAAVPDRSDIWHELGERLFYDGALAAIADSRERATAAFRRAADLDPAFASPLQYLMQLAAITGDTASVRQTAATYLRLDSIGDLSGFVAWRSAVALGNPSRIRAVRGAIPRMPSPSLRAILLSSQFNGVAVSDAERALTLLRSRAVGASERREAQLAAHALALNGGQTRAALRAIEELEEPEPFPSAAGARMRMLDALYGGGDSSAAVLAANGLIARIRTNSTSTPAPGAAAEEDESRCAMAQWNAWRATSMNGTEKQVALAAVPVSPAMEICRALVDAISAVQLNRPDAPSVVVRLDSITVFGPPLGSLRHYVQLAMARLYAKIGDNRRALSVVQRRAYMDDWPPYLAAHLGEEGRLAAASGDSTAARRAYRHYLELRENPEPSVRAEVDSIRSVLKRFGVAPLTIGK